MEAELLFITATIISHKKPFVNTFVNFFQKIFSFSIGLFIFAFCTLRFVSSTTTLFFGKIHKNHYDKLRKIFHTILFTKNYDKKSYKMDIYKSVPRVYNYNPE